MSKLLSRSKAVDAAWLAAMIDGEGCVEVNQRRVSVINTDMRLLDEVQRIAGCGSVYRHGSDERGKQCYRWATRAKANVVSVLSFVLPSLIAKRDKADLVIRRCL